MQVKPLIFTSLLISLSIMGCQDEVKIKQEKRNYDEIRDFSIKYEEVFNFDDPYYFIYIYSLNCLHCELIKSDVINYAFSNQVPMKFIEYYPDIPVSDDVSNTIGLKSIENLSILGTPALMLIENNQLAINISGMEIIKNVLNEYK